MKNSERIYNKERLYNNVLRRLVVLPPWTLTVVCAAAILYLTLMPDPLPDVGTPMIPGLDKVVHAVMFGGLYMCVFLDIQRRHRPWMRRVAAWGAVAVTVSGALVEAAQTLMAMGRGGDVWDLVADAVGVALAAVILWPRRRGRR